MWKHEEMSVQHLGIVPIFHSHQHQENVQQEKNILTSVILAVDLLLLWREKDNISVGSLVLLPFMEISSSGVLLPF